MNEDASDGIVVYPNPSRGVTYIKNAPQSGTVEVYNQIGQRVTTSTIENGSAEINLFEQVKGSTSLRLANQVNLFTREECSK